MSTRRSFLKGVGLASAGLALNPSNVFANTMTSAETANAKKDKVRIAYVGIGNRGEQNITEFAKTEMVDVVALCDVDLDGKERSGATHNLSFVALPQVASILYRQWTSLCRKYGKKAVLHVQAKNFTVISSDEVQSDLDGEIGPLLPIRVETIPKAIEVYCV